MKIQLVNFVVQGLSFLMKLLGFMNKAIKLLLTEWYIPALTSNSVHKSILLKSNILCTKFYSIST